MDRPTWQRWIMKVAATKPGSFFYVNIAPKLDRVLLRISGGRISTGFFMPVVLIDAIGAKSGQLRRTPLVTAPDGDRLVIVASRGGDTRNPGWYYNLRAHPEVDAQYRGAKRRYVAREVEGEERERMWQLAAGAYPGYNTYQQRAGERRIPVLVLEPV
jgi:deazaflavin-dependent oxidoreductase (nitroreductase family)